MGEIRVRDFDRFAEAIEGQLTLETSAYMVTVSQKLLNGALPKGAPGCPELPVFVTHEWYLKNEIGGHTFDEMRVGIENALQAWNDEFFSLNMQFFGSTTADRDENGESQVDVDPIGLLPVFTGAGLVATGLSRALCLHDQNIRHVYDGFVWFAEGVGEWLKSLPPPHNTKTLDTILGHEFGHNLTLGHSCGSLPVAPCDDPYLNEAIMRSAIHIDGRGATLGQWDKDQIQILFDGNPEPCAENETTLCLNEQRFQVRVEWRDFEDRTGSGRARPLDDADDSGLFWFFNSDNIEMIVKVLNACDFNNHYWVFAAATTNVEYTLQVLDTFTGQTREYFNPLGTCRRSHHGYAST